MVEILLYGVIGTATATQFIRDIDAANGQDITVRINTDGGSPEDLFGMVSKFREHTGKKYVRVDGKAYSAGAAFLPFSDNVTALDVSQFLIHRAAYSVWFEKSDYMTEPMWENLNNINKSLRSALESRIDVAKFEALKGVKMDDIFANETRIDVFLTAKEAKKIGLIDKIDPITPQKRAEMQSFFTAIAAQYVPTSESEQENEEIIMNIDDLKAKHPDLYKTIHEAGITAGIQSERDRVGAWMTFVEDDPELVTAGITEGKDITQTEMAKFTKKAMLKSAQSENATDTGAGQENGGGAKTAEQINAEKADEFEKELDAKLGIKTA